MVKNTGDNLLLELGQLIHFFLQKRLNMLRSMPAEVISTNPAFLAPGGVIFVD